jgi:hypothetical protein
MPEAFQELLIPFGASGYVAMYRVERKAVVVLTPFAFFDYAPSHARRAFHHEN